MTNYPTTGYEHADFVERHSRILSTTGYWLVDYNPTGDEDPDAWVFKIAPKPLGYFSVNGPRAKGYREAELLVEAFLDGYMAAERAIALRQEKEDEK